MTDLDREQMAQWVEKYLDDTLSPAEFDQLQQKLTDQPAARELYLDLMHQHAHLKLDRTQHTAIRPVAIPGSSEKRHLSRPIDKRIRLSAVIAVAACLLLMVGWWSSLPDVSVEAPTNAIAQIADSFDARWGDCSLPTAVGSQLVPGRLKIDRGLATIRFTSGAEVTLESPAELEMQSPLAGRLISGTAVVEVPDSAHGFTLATPTAIAIDHGTAFAVTVDSSSQTSAIEVLGGEVEVKHVASNAALRLKQKQRVVASATELSDSVASFGEAKLFGTQAFDTEQTRWIRITTADGDGGDASVSRSLDEDVLQNSHSELVLIKNPYRGYERFGRMGYFRFDLSSLSSAKVASARFVLTLMPSGLGFASKVGDCEFTVYGLTHESDDDWSEEQIAWQTAPANLDGAAEVDADRVKKLGRFVVRRGVQHGQVSIEGKELVQFLNADTNQRVTLIVVRETKELEPGGLVHGFTNQSSSVGAPPMLVLSTRDP